MLEKVKLSLRVTATAFDAEIESLIASALLDIEVAGIDSGVSDPLVERAVITYCRLNFGSPEDYDRLKRSYDEQKAQLQMATGYGLRGE